MDRNSHKEFLISKSARRPFTGAWIETIASQHDAVAWSVAPSRGRGSKLLKRNSTNQNQKSPLHGGVDRNLRLNDLACDSPGSPLHGGVDRNNLAFDAQCVRLRVAPSRGRGSKPQKGPHDYPLDLVAPSRGRGSKQQNGWAIKHITNRRPFTGAWIETAMWPLSNVLALVAPSRGRGSKRHLRLSSLQVTASPLHGGVDRNEVDQDAVLQPLEVAPSRGRGSKRALK